jgi:23S rRNA (adenine2503-C2)-methyltransferase
MQPGYRAKQLLEGILQGARSLEQITTVPQNWRDQLIKDGVRTGRSIPCHSVSSPDGTRKFLLQLYDGRVVEAVGRMPSML